MDATLAPSQAATWLRVLLFQILFYIFHGISRYGFTIRLIPLLIEKPAWLKILFRQQTTQIKISIHKTATKVLWENHKYLDQTNGDILSACWEIEKEIKSRHFLFLNNNRFQTCHYRLYFLFYSIYLHSINNRVMI